MNRLLITKDGECFARFDDSSTIYLSSSCHVVVETSKENQQTTHIVDFINHELKPKVTQMIVTRNKYFSPVCVPAFMQKKSVKKRLLAPLTEAIWTQQCQADIETSTQSIRSSDGYTSLRLHANQHQLHITYPVYIGKQIQVTPHGSTVLYHEHVEQHKIESIYHHDLCWQFPLTFIKNKMQHITPTKRLHSVHKVPLPHAKQSSLQASMAKLSSHTMKAIEYFHCTPHGVPLHQLIVVEWSKEAVYRIFNAPDFLVEIFVSLDGSYLITHQNKQFIHHYIPQRKQPQSDEEEKQQAVARAALEYVYSVRTVPRIPPDTNQEDATYDLQRICENAMRLVENANTQHQFQQTATSKNLAMDIVATKMRERSGNMDKLSSMSNHVKHYYIHPKSGEFMYFEDKRVRIHFSDRTMLELHSDWKHCSVITRYGQELKHVDCENPIESLRRYIQEALNYANWCSLSKAQRLNYQQSQLKIQNDIQQQLDFSQRVLESQKLTQTNPLMETDIVSLELQAEQSETVNEQQAMDQAQLIHDIQAQLEDIDRLLV